MPSAQPFRDRSARWPNLLFAWFVHLYTACGALAAFFGVIAVLGDRYRTAFLCMMMAALIDATDGVLARRAHVKDLVPEFDGARLDDIVDYLTFVFLPILLLYRSGALPSVWGWVIASIVLLSSAYGFGSVDAKTSDGFFTGFPSYWNVVALYLYAAGMQPAINAWILLVLSAMVFVRTGYVYPSRMPVLRRLTVVLGLIWGGMVVAVIVSLPRAPRPLLIASLFYPIYYIAVSFFLHSRRSAAPAASHL